MSLILEALKRSEAERRLGQAPGLLSPAPYARRRRRLPPLLLAIAATAVIAAGAAWWLLRAFDAPPQLATEAPLPVAAQPAAPAPVGEPAEPIPAASATRQSSADAAIVEYPAARTSPPRSISDAPAQAATVPAVARPPDDPAFRSIERESRPVPAGDVAPRTPRVAAPTPVPATPADTVPSTQSASAPASRRAQPADAAPLEALPRLRELPADTRAALPPLKLSMHVYAEVPDERFVLIDGRRYGEGMALAEGLLLQEIRRDGTVLEFRGRRFLLPRPG